MSRSLAHKFVYWCMCLLVVANFVNGQVRPPCVDKTDACEQNAAESATCPVAGAMSPCCASASRDASGRDTDDQADVDPRCPNPFCKIVQSLVYLPSDSQGSLEPDTVQRWVFIYSEPALADHLQAVYRPPRS